MRKRKKELILAARAVKQQMFEADEALQSQHALSEVVQNQRGLLDLQLQQILTEYGMAQELIESSRHIRECRALDVELPLRSREAKVGTLALTAGVATWQSNKDVQEDRYMLDIELKCPEGRAIAGYAVLDGHSGSRCVDHIVEHFAQHLQTCLAAKPKLSDDSLSKAVHEACALTDEEFLVKAREVDMLDGSTMILALLYPGEKEGAHKLLTACIGDSRAVLCRSTPTPEGTEQQFTAVPLSDDHKPNRPDEQQRVEAKGGIIDFEGVWRVFMPGPAKFGGQHFPRWGLAVSRAFGDLLLKEPEKYEVAGVSPGGLVVCAPEIRVLDLQPGHDRFLVLASDGVWDVMTNESAVAVCATQPNAEAAAQRLLRHTYAANTDDNITALVLTWRSTS